MIGFVLAIIPFILFVKGSKIRAASKVVQTLREIEGIGGSEKVVENKETVQEKEEGRKTSSAI